MMHEIFFSVCTELFLFPVFCFLFAAFHLHHIFVKLRITEIMCLRYARNVKLQAQVVTKYRANF